MTVTLQKLGNRSLEPTIFSDFCYQGTLNSFPAPAVSCWPMTKQTVALTNTNQAERGLASVWGVL